MDATKHNNNVLIPAFVIEINNCKNFNQLLHINWKIATKTKRLTNWYWFHVRIIGRKHSKEKNYITYNSALKMVKKGKYKLMYYFIYFLRNTISMNHIWNIFITHFIFKHICLGLAFFRFYRTVICKAHKTIITLL